MLTATCTSRPGLARPFSTDAGRFATIHLKDYSPEAGKGYRVLFGAPWKQIFQALEKTGGIQFYLLEQEGYSLPKLETVKLCLGNYKKIRG